MMKFFSIFIRNPAPLREDLAMKKIILLTLVVLLLLIPGTASAILLPTFTVTIADDGLSFSIYFSNGETVIEHIMLTYCDGTYRDEYIFIKGGLNTYNVDKPISHVESFSPQPNGSSLGLDASRNCEPGAEPLFMMWLLTRGDEGCILLSETHPSVERQKALCFPATDPDWVADNAPCADYVHDNGTDYGFWSCDAFGFSRLPLYDEDRPDLWEVWQRHAARQEE
jgi:hypothetical protein